MKLKLWRSLLLGLLISNAIALGVESQIVPDGTTDTTVNSTDNTITIDSGDRSGDNLFHSFEQFDLLNGNEAFFNNQSDIANIFSRVTGGDLSNIDGLIRANGDANLFLINPAGIIFGEGAALDLGGSFTAATAESIVFSDDLEFNATDSENPPLLTVNMPIGLNFGNEPGDLTVNGSSLSVAYGETLALLGGELTITAGQIIAPGANIELGGLSEVGRVSLGIEGSQISSNATTQRSDVTLTNGTNIDVQATGEGNIAINARNLELSGGELGASNLIAGIAPQSDSPQAQAGDIILNATGNITIRGSGIFNSVEYMAIGDSGRIDITTDNLSLMGGGRVGSRTLGQGNAGEITINAEDTIEIDGENSVGSTSGISIFVDYGVTSGSGGIDITTDNLSLMGGGRVDTSTFGQGNAGKITIDAKGTIEIDGEDSFGFASGISSVVNSRVTGDSGGIDITTDNLSLMGGGRVDTSTFGQGNAGKITIDAKGTIEMDGEDSFGFTSGIYSLVVFSATSGSGGIDITTNNLSLMGGGRVDTSTFGQGNAGKITIDAKGTIEIDGEDSFGIGSGISSRVESPATGDSDGIDITTDNLSLIGGGRVDTSTAGEGNAGKITINAKDTIEIDGESSQEFSSGIFSFVEETGLGNAADININTSSLSVANNAEISVESLGQGNASNLEIRANSLSLSNEASLFASTSVDSGGNIELQIAENLTLEDNSTISAEALENANGGNIEIVADFVIAEPNGNNDLIASAAEGTGGDIDITTNAIFGLEERSSTPPNNTNDLDASSELGVDGIIEINELEANPTEGLEELPVEVIDATRSVAQNLCQQGRGSEFVVTGKGGNAPSPTQARDRSTNDVDLVEPVRFSGTEAAKIVETPEAALEIVEAKGWIVNDRGMVELVARKTNVDSSPARSKNTRVCHKQ